MAGESSNMVEAQPAYVLHRSSYRENSFLLDVFTRDYGYLRLVAKGAGRKKSSGSAQLQVFQPLILSWTGRGELKTLTRYESPSPAISLFGNYLYCAYYLNELLLYLAPPYSPLGDMFAFYSQALAELEQGENPEFPLRRFELRLLGDLGLKPEFSVAQGGEQVRAGLRYFLGEDQIFCESSPLGESKSRVLHERIHDYSGETLLWLDRECPDHAEFGAIMQDKALMKEAKHLMRKLTERALNGRVLKSREMLRQMTEAGKQ